MKRIFLLAVFAAAPAFAQSTLDAVKTKGYLQCGVNTGLAGFSQPDSKGVWRGIDVDLCRAVAVGVFRQHTAASRCSNRAGFVLSQRAELLDDVRAVFGDQ